MARVARARMPLTAGARRHASAARRRSRLGLAGLQQADVRLLVGVDARASLRAGAHSRERDLEGERLQLLRTACRIIIVSGQGAYEQPSASEHLGGILSSRGIPFTLDLWGYDVNHDWPWWRKMLPHYLGQL